MENTSSHQCAIPSIYGGELSAALGAFEGISLEELKNSDATLLSRKEKKFLMSYEQAVHLIAGLAGSYLALEIEDARIGRYETLYYDTDTFMTYLWHHNGKANRYKL
ncbi:MAG: hypothetical protein LUQ25_09815, partial [Methanoregulaceae archaeon]|nr:hypothetical protein [Methanoregulaceae archaeon]